MGLISWIKGKYYDSRLGKADRLVSEKDLDKAEEIYRSLLGKHDLAIVHLADMFVTHSQGVEDKLSALKKIVDLQSFSNEQNKQDYETCLNVHLNSIESLVNNAYNDGKEQEAYEILDGIIEYPKYWLPGFIRLRNRDFSKVTSLGQRLKFEEETISQITDSIENVQAINEPLYFELWDRYIDLLYNKAKAQPKDKAIDSFIKVRSLLNTQCHLDYANEKMANLTKDIVKLEWSCATEYESDMEYDRAIALYEAIKSENLPSYKGRAELRALICVVKSSSIDDSKEQRIVNALNMKSHESLKDDLAYRYACYLLQSDRSDDAEQVLKKYLPNEKSLLAICENIVIKESEKCLLDFNNKVKSVIEGTMTVADAISFLQEIDQYKSNISKGLPDIVSKFDIYKRRLAPYILNSILNEQQYEKNFLKFLSIFPAYIENDNLFRNVAITALSIVETGTAEDAILKYAISIWLSAVYADRLFVKSLDYTSWDDDYTFTLQGSLGKTSVSDYKSLPDNINFDYPIDNQNIAIKDVQVSLSSRMETFIRDNYPQFEQFFTDEKEALDNLMELNLEQDFVPASPYMAMQKGTINKSIKEALDYDIAQGYDNAEDALNLGVRYGFTGDEYSSYKDAQQKVEICKAAMTGGLTTIRSAFSSLPQIKNYPKLYASLKSFVSSRMNDNIKTKMDYKEFIDVYEIVCKGFNEAPLSLAFSNYANGEIVQRLNDNRMQLRKGVEYMVRVYLIAPSSIQVKQNLEGMLVALAVQAEQNNSSADRTTVDIALRDTGYYAFKPAVDAARIQAALSVIVDKVNGGSMSKDKALKEVYELYKKDRNNDRICENLVTLCDICIAEYIIANKSGKDSVITILDSLGRNKSSCFSRYKDKLAYSYNKIWSQLSPHERRLMKWGIDGGVTLNDRGMALQKGLDYYKDLGDVPQSRFNDFRSLLDDDCPF